LAARSFDLVVIGAGFHGATVSLCAQSSGLRTALVTRGDLASGATGRLPMVLRRGPHRSSMTGFLAGFGPHLLREIAIGAESMTLVDGARYVVEAVVSAIARGLVVETHRRVLGVETVDGGFVVRVDGDAVDLEARSVVLAIGAGDVELSSEADRALAGGEVALTESLRFDRAIDGRARELAIGETRAFLVPLGQSTRAWAEAAGSDLVAAVRAGEPALDGLVCIEASSIGRRLRDPPGHVDHGAHGGTDALFSVNAVSPGAAFDAARAVVERVHAISLRSERRFATPLGETFSMSASAIAERYRLPEHAAARLIARRGSGAYDVLGRTDGRPAEGAILCECEPVLECEAHHAIEVERARTLEGLALRTDLGNGPCAGSVCAHRAARLLSSACGIAPSVALAEATEFLARRRRADDSERTAADELNDARFCASGIALDR
jgi:glycerol-3-phosphate dehydrogenase